MDNEGLLPSAEERGKRKNVISSLKKIVANWAKKVAWQSQLRREQIAATSAAILTYGSYGLGVYGVESDIDALCVGPFFATMAEDFFIVLRNMLKSRPEVSDIHCVKDAKVPLMRFKFDGISVDLPYAQLKLLTIPDLELLQGFCDPCLLEYVDIDTSESNVVFYWGLNPSRIKFKDIETAEEDFLKNICGRYRGIPKKMSLSIIHASELPKNDAQNRSGKEKKSMKACWKIVDKPRIPEYSRHLPDYLVGYVATDGDTKYRGDEVELIMETPSATGMILDSTSANIAEASSELCHCFGEMAVGPTVSPLYQAS